MTARLVFCWLLLTVFCAAALPWARASAPGYASCLSKGGLHHWTHFPLRVYFAPGLLRSPERLAQVRAGFDEWVNAAGGAVCYQCVSKGEDADIFVSIASRITLPKDARALGQTVLSYEGAVMTRADLELVERDDDPAQFQEICAHEFGHALGLDGHSDDPRDMMFPVLAHSLFQVRSPQLDFFAAPGVVTPRDLATLAAAYPALHFPAPKR